MSDQPYGRPDTTRALWDAVDGLTKPTSRKVGRDINDADWLWELANDPTLTVCDVAAYRAATLAYGHIPALWDQAQWALTTGLESGGSGSSPLRERSPADLDLMETMLTVRETILTQLQGRGLQPRHEVKAQMRQLTAYLVTNGPAEHVEWWTFRFAQWGRLITNHLNAADHAPKPVHLRNTACPECSTRQVTITDKDSSEKRVFPAILIDFENDMIRAAWCQACGYAWFRGDQLGELANLVDRQPGRMTA